MGYGWSKALHPDDTAHTLEVWTKAVATRSVYNVEYRIRRHDGEYRHFLARGVPVMNDDGSVREWVGTCTDITERKEWERKLRDNEARLQTILSTAIDGFWRVGTDGRFIEVNEAYCRMSGYAEGELLGATLDKVEAMQDIKEILRRIEQIVIGGAARFESAHRRKDGSTFEVDVSAQYQMADGGSIVVFLRDITERKRSEEALRESEERLHLALASSGVGTWSWDMEEGSIVWDDYLHPLFGLQPGTFAGTYEAFQEMVHPEDRERVAREVSDSVERDLPFKSHYRVVWPDQSEHYLAARGKVYRDASGKPTRMTGVCWDITEAKLAEEALRESRAHLQFTLESAKFGDWDLNLLDDTSRRSLRHDECFGYNEPIADWGFEKFIQAVHPEDRERVERDFRKATSNLEPWDFECRIHWPDGSLHWITARGSVYRREGKALRLHGIVEEITERKEAEEKLRRFAEELQRSNQELEHFAYVASHDLQEPLRTVGSFAQLIERRYKGKLDDDADEFINYIVDGASRMQRLINDLLTYSRVGTRGRTFQRVDTQQVLSKVIQDIDSLIQGSGAVITHDEMPMVSADEVQLRQLLQNLIGNGVKFRKPGEAPAIHVAAKQVNGEWEFRVRDNGIGIEPQYFERVFVIFQRLHGRNEYEGTGIGLAVCKKIVERHGGRIWVESEPGAGATFCFTLPVCKETNEQI